MFPVYCVRLSEEFQGRMMVCYKKKTADVGFFYWREAKGSLSSISDRSSGQSCRAPRQLHYHREKRGNAGEMKQGCFITAINPALVASLLSPMFVQDYEWIEFPLKSDGSMSSIIRDFVILREKSKSIKNMLCLLYWC